MSKKTKLVAEDAAAAVADAAPTTILSVPLDSLEHDPVAVEGHEQRLKSLDDLLASLPIKGQLQSLKVRPSPASDVHSDYWVTAGNRRLAALRALQKSGGSIKGVKVTGEFPVHVIVSAETDADAYESSRSENLQRLPETPVEEFRAFAKMAKTKSVKDIAAVFGCTAKRVEQRLRLAALHEDVLAALEAGKITMEAAQAFTVEPDPDKQAAYLKKNGKNSWALSPGQVKQAFTQKLVRGDSALAQLIGRKDYLAAGGKVLGDAFDDASYWISQDVIDRLAEAAWKKKTAAWLEEGWSFVETAATFTGGDSWKLYHCETVGEDDENGQPLYTAEDKARAGVVFWPDASREPRIGICRFVEEAGPRSQGIPPNIQRLPSAALTVARDAIQSPLAAAVRKSPELALQLLVATLRTTEWNDNGPLSVHREFAIPAPGEAEPNKDRLEGDVAFVDALKAVAHKQLPELVLELADLLSWGVEPSLEKGDLAFIEHAGVRPAFDPAPFFAQLTKPFVVLCWQDMTGETMPDDELGAMRQAASAKAFDTGWLPPQIRTASYAGPAFAPREAESGDDKDHEEFVEDELDDSDLQAAE